MRLPLLANLPDRHPPHRLGEDFPGNTAKIVFIELGDLLYCPVMKNGECPFVLESYGNAVVTCQAVEKRTCVTCGTEISGTS